MVSWLIDDIQDRIDPKQFGCLKGTPTTYCLLDMINTWHSWLDTPGNHLRLCFLDFAKAFDRIGHNVLIVKLIDLGVRRSLIPWIINFLSNRRRRVKLGDTISNCIVASKPGPILFLVMINDLKVISHGTDIWKFVDDISASERLVRNGSSDVQSNLHSITSRSSENFMKLNSMKCKELRVCFLRETPELLPLVINGQILELVHSHKVLGLIIQSNLK